MVDVKFKKLPSLPSNLKPGTFYWIGEQVWFATDSGVVLLSNELGQELLDRLEGIEKSIEDINDIFGSEGIDLTPYITDDVLSERLEEIRNEILSKIEDLSGSDFENLVTRDELDNYIRRDEYVPGIVELEDSDYEEIAEHILTWETI